MRLHLRDWFKKRLVPNRATLLLWLASPVTAVLERAFALLQYLSILTYLVGTRSKLHSTSFKTPRAKRAGLRRGRITEAYIATCGIVVTAALLISPTSPVSGLLLWTAYYRLADIVLTAVNITIFDRFRIRRRHFVSSIARLTVLSLWNFAEAAICFGAIYRIATPTILTWQEALLQSLNIQLAMGVPDSYVGSPWLPVTQAGVGFLLGLIALSRFIGFLPAPRSLVADDKP